MLGFCEFSAVLDVEPPQKPKQSLKSAKRREVSVSLDTKAFSSPGSKCVVNILGLGHASCFSRLTGSALLWIS